MVKDKQVLSLEDLSAELGRLRAANRRIVLCHGVFDLLHVGHVRHLAQARAFGDVLVVTLTPDRFVNKGANRPAFPEALRAEVLAALDCVDYVAVNRWPTAVETIHLLRPHVFVKGSEFRDLKDVIGHVSQEAEAVRAVGGEVAFTEDITFSSSGLINEYLSQVPEDVRNYLADFARRYSLDDVLGPLRAAADKRVLVVGEAIIDEYAYCEVIGKSGKEPILASRYFSTDRFAGGALACANHLAGFCNRVDVLTFLGEGRDQEGLVRQALRPNVNPLLLYKKASPTIVKTRFVERYLAQKLFEVYHMNDEPLGEKEDAEFCALLGDVLPRYDLVVVADYGHGMLSARAIQALCDRAPFLAVNTQSNAGNHGFNMISKYGRADYVCLAKREFALETRNQRLSSEEMVLHVARKLACRRVMLTLGKYGTLYFSEPEGFKRVPAFANQVVDRVGAGDAVLCLTALCVAANAPAEVVGFVGNVTGAEAVAILGNQRPIERAPLFRHVECLLKVHKASGPGTAGPSPFKLAA
jgi:rfaE bifunctional protein nucleotidyltransferase chain/domain